MKLPKAKKKTEYPAQALSVDYRGVMRFLPLIVVGGFFLLTILMFAFGPVDWKLSNPVQLYLFLTACVLALAGGYFFAAYKKEKPVVKPHDFDINKVLFIGAIVFLVMYIPTIYCTTHKWYPDLITGFTNTGAAYRNTKYWNENGNQFILYVRMILSPFMISVMPITIYYMPRLNKVNKILGIIVIILTVTISISQGINKAVADFTAQMVLMLMILLFANNIKNKRAVLYRLKIIGLILVVCLSFVFYFTNGMRNRVANDISGNKTKVTDEDITNRMLSYATFSIGKQKENYFLAKILPAKAESAVVYLTSYLTHGYKGLSYALTEPFTSTWGLGFSDFFRHNFLKVFHFETEQNVIDSSYYGKIKEFGWKTGGVWSSFFVYPASDISFYGTILLVFLIGFLFGKSWRDSLETVNPFALASFSGFSTMIFYFSANNQMFQTGENFIGFSVMILLWLLTDLSLRSRKFRFGLPSGKKSAA